MPFYTDTGTLILKPKYPATVNKTTSYDWLVSPVNEPAVDAFVKVEASGRQQVFLSEDVSDVNFTIIPAVEFTNPLAGESLPFGSVTTVSWALKTTNAYVASLDLEYRIAKGKGWVTIASGLPKTTASQVWNIPTLTRDRPNASLRLVLNDAAGNEVSQTLVPVQLLQTL
jgi:hypothetical protein